MVNVLAIDLGASGGRVILGAWDEAARQVGLREIHRFANEAVELNGTLYWDILRLFHEIKTGIRQAVNSLPAGQTLACLGIDTWGVDFGLLDASGQLLANPVHYRDHRTDGVIPMVASILGEGALFRRTGVQDAWFNTVYQLVGAQRRDPQAFDRAAALLFTPDLLNYFLTGIMAAERTIASTSQLLKAGSADWDDGIFLDLGLPRRLMQAVVEPGTILGPVMAEVALDLGLAPGTPVALVPSHDTESAALAVPTDHGGARPFVFVNCGTWSVLGAELPAPVLSEACRLAGFSNEAAAGGTTCLLRNIMGMWLLQECKRWWERDGSKLEHGQLAELAAGAAPWQHHIDVNHDLFAPPGDMPARINAYCLATGQSQPQSRAEVLRCVIESLACAFRQSLAEIESLSGLVFGELWIVGGGSRNRLLCDTTAGLIGRPVITGPAETTALGNIMCQLRALDHLGSMAACRQAVARSFGTNRHVIPGSQPAEAAYHRWLAIKGKAPPVISAQS